MNKKVLLLLVLTLLLQVSYSTFGSFGSFGSFGKGPSFGGNAHNSPWNGGKPQGSPHSHPHPYGPTVHSKCGQDIEIAKQNSGGFFGGFTDTFKA